MQILKSREHWSFTYLYDMSAVTVCAYKDNKK